MYLHRHQAIRASQRIKRTLLSSFLLILTLSGSSVLQAKAPGDWDNTIALTVLNGDLYSIEKGGALYRTDLNAGSWVQVGKADFANTAFLFADNRDLFTIETDGSLYRISPGNGAWVRIGQAGEWRNTKAVVMLNNILFTIERGGALYRTNLATGSWVQLGKAEYGNTRFLLPGLWRQIGKPEFAGTSALFGAIGWLYSLEAGNLYRINPSNGSWAAIK